MSKGQSLRALVNERLTAAAEDIFALFERTIAEYEEELCRSKEENERKQQLLDSVLSPRETQHKIDVQVQAERRKEEDVIPALDQNDQLSIKDEEEEEFPFIPDLLVKGEDDENWSSLLQQTEHREEAQAEDCTSEDLDFKPLDSEMVERIDISSDSDNDEDWETQGSSSAHHMETKADGDDYNRTKNNLVCNSLEMILNEDLSGNDIRDKIQNHECLACGEAFQQSAELQRHMAAHAGEKPFSCPVCNKGFTRKNILKLHLAVHTGDTPFNCAECDARFALKHHLESHMRIHNSERPFSCPVCKKCFTRKYRLRSHMATHTGERPFSCPVCEKSFTRKDNLSAHMSTHTGEKRFICAICNKCFTRKDRLTSHMATHTGEKLLA